MSKISLRRHGTRSAIPRRGCGQSKAGHSLILISPCECTAGGCPRVSFVFFWGEQTRVDATRMRRRTTDGVAANARTAAPAINRNTRILLVSLAHKLVRGVGEGRLDPSTSLQLSLDRLAQLLADKPEREKSPATAIRLPLCPALAFQVISESSAVECCSSPPPPRPAQPAQRRRVYCSHTEHIRKCSLRMTVCLPSDPRTSQSLD